MKMAGRVALIIASFWTGAVVGHTFLSGLSASPQDVHGSPGVAVAGYKNSKGSYLVWADGHITNATSGVTANAGVATANAYTTDSNVTLATVPAGVVTGSPNTAVAVIPMSYETLIAFGNGKLLKPVDAGAGAGAPSSGTVRWLNLGSNNDSSGDISLANGSGGTTIQVAFDPPFTTAPLCLGFGQGVGGPLSNGVAQNQSCVCGTGCTTTSALLNTSSVAVQWVVAIGN